jgi:serine phosphatase RsbU (regulator of sigma subunit)
VAGKGIAAALVTAIVRTTLRAIAQPVVGAASAGRSAAARSAAATLRVAGRLLHHDLGSRDFVACAGAVVEAPAGAASAGPAGGSGGGSGGGLRLRLSNAAQIAPLLWRDGHVETLVPPGERLPLGVLPDGAYEDLVLDLVPGDTIAFASDGLVEAPARADGAPVASGVRPPLFGFERLAESLALWAAQGTSAQAVLEGVWQDVAAWSGGSSEHDDMTLVILRVPQAPLVP